ncbi:MAG: YkvA family protein [Cyclobacteriaceae bacterium]|nr:YkvA family protein [Cyclobacteriaceae bacterium]
MSLLKNIIFQQAMQNASGIASSPDKMTNLIDSVTKKMTDTETRSRIIGDFFYKVRTLVRMLRAYVHGSYRQLPWKSLLMIIGGLLYFLMPIDIIPDFIPVTGLADDITIILMVFRSINKDIQDFIEFEDRFWKVELNERDEFFT